MDTSKKAARKKLLHAHRTVIKRSFTPASDHGHRITRRIVFCYYYRTTSRNLTRLDNRNPLVSGCPQKGVQNHCGNVQTRVFFLKKLETFSIISSYCIYKKTALSRANLQFHMESHRRYKASANGVAPVNTKIRAKLYAASRVK